MHIDKLEAQVTYSGWRRHLLGFRHADLERDFLHFFAGAPRKSTANHILLKMLCRHSLACYTDIVLRVLMSLLSSMSSIRWKPLSKHQPQPLQNTKLIAPDFA